MKKNILLLMLCLFSSIGVVAQTKSISGLVTDATGEPIIGASVIEVGTTNGTITDLDGKFTLNMNPNGKLKFRTSDIRCRPSNSKEKLRFEFN